MTQETKHFAEPWTIEVHESHDGVEGLYIVSNPMPVYENGDLRPVCFLTTEADHDQLDDANAARIVACVNACEGMADPSAEIAALKSEIDRLNKMVDMLSDMQTTATIKKIFGNGGTQ